MTKLGCIYIILLLSAIITCIAPINAQKERVGMSDDLNFMIVGIDGYYTDGREQYYRIGDHLIVRGSVSGSAGSISIKVVAPDGSIWYSNDDVRLGYAQGYSYYVMDDGVKGKEWSSDSGFYVKVKQFTADDLEGVYRLSVEAGSSMIEREVAFKRVEGSYSDEVGALIGSDAVNGRGWDGGGIRVAIVVSALIGAVVAGTVVMKRKRRSSSSKEVTSI
ncbi:MAG: hypothetical protein QXR25_07950 [Candidatus Nitrosocaldus sp.]